jgi:hypothetical protein
VRGEEAKLAVIRTLVAQVVVCPEAAVATGPVRTHLVARQAVRAGEAWRTIQAKGILQEAILEVTATAQGTTLAEAATPTAMAISVTMKTMRLIIRAERWEAPAEVQGYPIKVPLG